MEEKNIKNVTEAEEIKVDMTVNSPEETKTEETKKTRVWNFAKKVGKAIWAGLKTTCAGVGAIVLGALTVGLVLGGKKNDEVDSGFTGGELDADETSTSNEISDETSNEEFDL